MPHRGARATLRPGKEASTMEDVSVNSKIVSEFRKMSAIQIILKFGLQKKLFKRKGWLFDLLTREGMFFLNYAMVVEVNFVTSFVVISTCLMKALQMGPSKTRKSTVGLVKRVKCYILRRCARRKR
jgi:hypothetical protein